MKGFTAPNGTIAVSWPDYVHGYQVEDDNYNLGLHELAHALHVNNSHSVDNKYFKRHFRIWSERSLTDFYDLRSGNNSFLRKYGGNNFHEFFAVCVEHFFESPLAFYEHIPNLYIRTCILLAQNPLNSDGDFAFEPEDLTEMNRIIRNRN
jgi:Mlc titration factor MtfA (ptsG expression regulator)